MKFYEFDIISRKMTQKGGPMNEGDHIVFEGGWDTSSKILAADVDSSGSETTDAFQAQSHCREASETENKLWGQMSLLTGNSLGSDRNLSET